MAAREHRGVLATALADAVAGDPVPVECHGRTRLGLFELTRERGTASTAATVALEVLGTGSHLPGPIEIRVSAVVAGELAGDLAPALDSAMARAGRKVAIIIDAGRDPETFDIGST
jgi:hypothetical protein